MSSRVRLLSSSFTFLATLMVALGQTGGPVVAGPVSYVTTTTSTPIYTTEPASVAVPYTSIGSANDWGGTDYQTTATYGGLSSGTILRFYTSDTSHVYGPYGSQSSEWSSPSAQGSYSGISLLRNSSGGSVLLYSFTAVTAVNYEGTVETQTGSLDEYNTVITYGALDAGSSLLVYTAGNVYGPYGSADSWGLPVAYDGYAAMTLADATSGGTVRVLTYSPLNSVSAVPEPTTYAMAIVGLACGGFSMWRRRKRA